MSFWSTSYFEYFNIDTQESHRQHGLADIEDRVLCRAKALLMDRTKQEINETITFVDAMCSDYFSVDNSMERLISEVDSNTARSSRIKLYSEKHGLPTAEYLEMMHSYDLSSLKSEVSPQWHEIFALLALNLIGESAAEDDYHISQREFYIEHEEDYMRLHHASYYLFSSLELITLAESFEKSAIPPEIEHEKSAKRRVSFQNKLAAKNKHAPVQKIKDKFIRWYNKQSYEGAVKSKSDAARQFYESLPDDKKCLLAPTNAERTLKDALRAYEKTRAGR